MFKFYALAVNFLIEKSVPSDVNKPKSLQTVRADFFKQMKEVNRKMISADQEKC